MFFVFIFLGMFVNNILYLMKEMIMNNNKITPFNFWNILKHIVFIIPHFSYSSSIAGFINISWKNNRFIVCNSSNMEEASYG